MQPKVLVTGAAGFIGSHLVDALTADGIAVRSFIKVGDDVSNLSESESEVVNGDLRDIESLKRAMEGIETVYHLAAISRYDLNVPEDEYRTVNVEGTSNVLTCAEEAGVKCVLFTATIEAVGLSEKGDPLTENSPPCPRNIYGVTKQDAEDLVTSYRSPGGMKTVVVRPPMTYGPREMILCSRLFKVIQRGIYPLVGSGEALTEFCYVKNQVQGIRLAAEKGKSGEVYFISDEKSYMIKDVVRAIAKELGVKVITPHLPVPLALVIGFTFEILSKIFRFYPFVIPQTGRPPFSRKTVKWTSESKLYCDISKARGELSYNPGYSMEDGIRETVAWYKSQGHMK
ncbi:MAG: NAD-dependent epimerase/dehydratase family protein [Kiritimatiellia bacterium]|jgi:UDP-glucose 4-epimerase|nr:NAD-dependent epimerase/dehydratase family protein [Kiritimatiellia bacterium]MDP6848244.1 NAD-dependent epimerase/dehydratase family protein [Kiritimatiellia bacterium]